MAKRTRTKLSKTERQQAEQQQAEQKKDQIELGVGEQQDHFTVLLHETVEGCVVDPDGIYVDGTFGRGGHTRLVLSRLTTGKMLGFDKDPVAIGHGKALEQEDYFANSPEKAEVLPDTLAQPLDDANIFDLIRAFQGVIQRFEETNDLGDIVDDRFTVSDKIEILLETTQPGQRKLFTSLFDEATTKSEIIVTFLAVLELMKMNQFKIIQDGLLGEIHIERNQNTSGSLYHTETKE